VEGTETHRRWLQRATVYALSMTAAGAVTGAVFAGVGALLHAVAPSTQLPLALLLGTAGAVYALHEVGFIALPVPGRDWQVPAEWVRHHFYRSAVIFGGIVGFGVFTRVPYASLPVLLAWLFISGNVWYGVLAGLVYGSARAVSIYLGASTRDAEGLVDLNHRLMSMIPALHRMTGVALAAFAVYLLVAPAIH
jgi:hypothetical protein